MNKYIGPLFELKSQSDSCVSKNFLHQIELPTKNCIRNIGTIANALASHRLRANAIMQSLMNFF